MQVSVCLDLQKNQATHYKNTDKNDQTDQGKYYFNGLHHLSLIQLCHTCSPRQQWYQASRFIAAFVCKELVKRAMGIEPTPRAWEAPVLPLNYTREYKRYSMGFRMNINLGSYKKTRLIK